MRYFFLLFLFIAIAFSLHGQDKTVLEKGKVSYISSQKVYVKFESTESINVGDTLFLNRKSQMTPFLVVNNKSSISCVCTRITSGQINISDEIIFQKNKIEKVQFEQATVQQQDSISSAYHEARFSKNNSIDGSNNMNQSLDNDDASFSQKENKLPKQIYKQKISGRISAASYNTIANSRKNHRFRYTFLMRGDHLGNSGLSFESYITFRHTLNEWEEVKNNLNNALKVYSLALKYDFSKTSRLIIGRTINPKISSIGASDGIQFEKGFGNFILGALVGSRPDHQDYSLNFSLFQYGAYISHRSNTNNSFSQTTIAFIEQRNNSKIDRRFIYFQHSNSLTKNLNFFGSAELSLYQNINDEPTNVLDLTNLYVSLRYRVSRRLNFSLSYDNRKNIQYYETYKNFIDKLIEEETRQGVRFHASYKLFKNVIWGINTGWRFQKSERNLSKNLNSYLTFSRIPGVNVRTTITANFLRTNYLDSKIFGIRLSKEIVSRKLNGDINYRWVDYRYLNYETESQQNIMGLNLSWNIIKRLSLYLNYEITFDSHEIDYHQIYSKIIQRF